MSVSSYVQVRSVRARSSVCCNAAVDRIAARSHEVDVTEALRALGPSGIGSCHPESCDEVLFTKVLGPDGTLIELAVFFWPLAPRTKR